ncbi:MAG: B-box zinc finger protein [Dehalococcoidales bacterium]|nr:B-box zinc finger protein [Dehalococcoidales bacterium]
MENMRCAEHPDVETNLRCGKCDKPICPKCMVETPVGARCPECARINKLPTFQVSNKQILVSSGVGLLIAVAYGFLWGMLSLFANFIFLNLLLGAGAGFLISEGMSRVINRKRGTKLAVIASILVVVSGFASIFTPIGMIYSSSPLFIILDILAVGIGIYVAVNRLR